VVPLPGTIKRLPTGDVSAQWSRSAGDDNYALVDDPIGIPDEDATYTHSDVAWSKDYLSFATFGVPTGAVITNIAIHERFTLPGVGGTDHMRGILKVNGTTYYSSSEDAWYGAYKTETWVWATNPNTGLPWTVDDVNGIGIHPLQSFGYECLTTSELRCTQVYIEVNYKLVG